MPGSFQNNVPCLRILRHGITVALVPVLLAACSASGNRQVPDLTLMGEMQQILADASVSYEAVLTAGPSEDVLRELVPGLSLSDDLLTPISERFNVVATRENARDFFNNLVAGTDYGVMMSPDVSGEISLNLPNVTIDDVMQAVRETYGFQISRRGNLYQIQAPGLETRIFTIDYLSVSRSGTSNVQVSGANANSGSGGQSGGGSSGGGGFSSGGGSGGVSGGSSGGASAGGGGSGGGGQVFTSTESDFWTDIQETLELMVMGSRNAAPSQSGILAGLEVAPIVEQNSGVIVHPQVGLIMVTATPAKLEQVADYLARAQDILSREVTIQVQFLEVVLNKGFQSAIDFDTFGPGGAADSNNRITSIFGAGSAGSGIDGISNPLTISTNFTDFNAVFRILESRGTTQVLSSPSLKVMNNQKAVFQDGDSEFFQTSVGSNVISTGSSVTETSANNLQPFFSGISMDITPQISADGTITLHVRPTITTVNEQAKQVAGQQVPLARTSVRELDSIIRAEDGKIVVLGGLAYERSIDDSAGIPYLNDLPGIGAAFDQRRQTTVKSEFIILLRPVIASPQSEQRLLRERSERLRSINSSLDPFGNP
jgi:MSHA biogenesis protein MshL